LDNKGTFHFYLDMLLTKNALFFRRYFKKERSDGREDLDFIGSLYKQDRRNIQGFASLTLGNREEVGKYLSTVALNVAADDQAIYELIQNADDSGSGLFSVSYNEKYLLCINNGSCFTYQDMAAIINVAGNFKDGEDIGTFGIGFKILHRLVGADDGREAIVNDYAGPIIFSWNRFSQFEQFARGEEIGVTDDYETNGPAPWLVKILNTCFPCHLGEELRLNDYQTIGCRFDTTELAEMRGFLKTALQDANLTERNYLRHGSVFFLKLGPGKHKFLADGIDKIKSGLSHSFKFLNHLRKIYINGAEIVPQRVESYSGGYAIGSADFLKVNPKNKNRDIRFTFAFYDDYKHAAALYGGQIPNLYTFFSMEEEKNGFGFILHCNAFDMNNDRRKLQANSQINEQLLPLIARDVLLFIAEQKGKRLYTRLYGALLLSQEPVGKEHINKSFFSYLKTFIRSNIPTREGYTDDPGQVRIRQTALDLQPAELGCPEIAWFYWYSEKDDPLLLQEARDPSKLALKNWDITDLLLYAIQKGQLDPVNAWVRKLEQAQMTQLAEERRQRETSPEQPAAKKRRPYFTLLRELDRQVTRHNFEALSGIQLFKYSDQEFYSLQEAATLPELILLDAKTHAIRFELQALGFRTSLLNMAEQANLNALIRGQTTDLALFGRIRERTKNNSLRKDQKHKLFEALAAFEHVGPDRLSQLELYKNARGKVMPLRAMLKAHQSLPPWLEPYRINDQEYSPALDSYLLAEKDIYRELILPNWEAIIAGPLNLNDFYQNVRYCYGLNEQNPALKDQAFVFINPKQGFLPVAQVFYHKNLSALADYIAFQELLHNKFDTHIPFRPLLAFFKEAPFKLDNGRLSDIGLSGEQVFTLDELKSLIGFCQLNEELFFQHYVIAAQKDQYRIMDREAGSFQVWPPGKELRQFIQAQLADTCMDLPLALDAYRESPGIVQGEALYLLILELIDTDEHLAALVDLIRYDQPKKNLLLGLKAVTLTASEAYDRESTVVKLFAMACDHLAPEQYAAFREKVTIAAGGQQFKLREIPPFADKITIQGKDLLLSEILTDSYGQSAHLSGLLDQLIALGLPKAKLHRLFGLADDPDPGTIYALLKTQNKLLANEQQLAFVLLYSQLTQTSPEGFEVITAGGNYSLDYPYYLDEHSFISREAVLESRYQGVAEILELPFSFGQNGLLLRAPYLEEGALIASYLETAPDKTQKMALAGFLYALYQADPAGFAAVDWGQIGELKTRSLLDFEPAYAVWPDEFALPEEQLPEYLQDWAKDQSEAVEFFKALGCWTTGSTLLQLRKSFAGLGEFSVPKLARETRFRDATMLLNTLQLISNQGWQLDEAEGMPLLTEMLRVLNTFRKKEEELHLLYAYDIELLAHAPEWQTDYYESWKAALEEQFRIYCYEGPLPQTVTMEGMNGYVFHRFNRGDVMIDEDNRIFINRHADIKSTLSALIAGDNDFDAESLLLLYQSGEAAGGQSGQVQELQNEIGRLRARIAQLEHTSGVASYNATVSHDDYHQEIKELSERYIYTQLKQEFPGHQVHWLNEDPQTGHFVESWADHDFEIRDAGGNIKSFIDCKGTPLSKQTFYLTSNEWHFSLRCKKAGQNYQIYRVYQADSQPEHLCINDPHEWIAAGKLVPYLSATETIRGDRVFLTIKQS